MKPLFLYIAGPYTKPDPVVNTAIAIDFADRIVSTFRFEVIPFVPHLYMMWHLRKQHDFEYWMSLDVAWLRKCDAIFRIPGDSAGADREVEIAKQLGLPVFYGYEQIEAWLREAHAQDPA